MTHVVSADNERLLSDLPGAGMASGEVAAGTLGQLNTSDPALDSALEKAATPTQQTDDESHYPWNEKGISSWLKLMGVLGILALLFVAFEALSFLAIPLLAIFLAPESLISEPKSLLLVLLVLAISVLVLGLCAFALKKIWRYASAPRDFKPGLGQVASTKLSEPFEVRFAKLLIARSYSGLGTVTFDEAQIVLNGTLQPGIGFQLGIIALVTVLPLVLFKCGLGILPALFLAFWLGKKETSRAVPYQDILKTAITGRALSISCSGEEPNQFKFRVSSLDAERLYRELYHHCPQAVAEWQQPLQEMVSTAE